MHTSSPRRPAAYYPAADALYLYLTERSASTPDLARTEEVASGVTLDFDVEDRVIGVNPRFGPGDAIFAPAGWVHRFEDFSPDFATWVVFWGPKGGEAER